jgi:predicted small secreted protein
MATRTIVPTLKSTRPFVLLGYPCLGRARFPNSGKVPVMRMSFIMRLSLAALLFGSVATISACNTIGGMGEDVSAVGKGVTRGADTTQKKM